jgi:membrane protease YdiL (CAAX protease family)
MLNVALLLCSSDVYAVNLLQYWVFIIGAPIGMVLAVLYAITDNIALGAIVSYILFNSNRAKWLVSYIDRESHPVDELK